MSRRAAAIARGVMLQVTARVLAVPLSVVALGVATRYLGTHDYGVLTTAVVFVGLFDTCTDLGVSTAIIRRAAGRDGDTALPRLVGVNLGFSLVYALPLALVASGVGWFAYAGQPQVRLAVLVVSAGLVFSSIASCFDPVFDVRVKYSGVAAAELGSRILTVAAALVVATTNAGLLAMCAVQVLPPLLRMIISAIAAGRLVRFRPTFAPAETLRLLRESLPFTVIILIAIVYWRADGVLLSMLSSPEQVAAYGLALQLAFSLTLLPQVFSRSALFTINESYVTDQARFRQAVDRGYRFLLLVAAPVAVLGVPLAGRIVHAVGSSSFTPAATPVLRLFFVAVAVSFLTGIVSDALVAARQQRFLSRLSMANLVLNVALNAVLIPLFGAVGTGISLLVTELSGVVCTQPRLRRSGVGGLPLGYLPHLAPGLAAALLALWATWSLPLAVPLACAGVAYVLGAWAGGAIPADMRTALLAALRPRSIAPTGDLPTVDVSVE
ncbi:MAG TPA: flippase [Pseudonocardiaceae bacterium]|nr:flippase [Pseudonocardiaceae bacterium]